MNGMSGILVSELEKIIKKTNYFSDEIKNSVKNIQTKSILIKKSNIGEDIDFLTANIRKEIIELNKVMKKINGNQTSIRNVLKGYQFQEQQLAKDIRRISN